MGPKLLPNQILLLVCNKKNQLTDNTTKVWDCYDCDCDIECDFLVPVLVVYSFISWEHLRFLCISMILFLFVSQSLLLFFSDIGK